ncbi:MAG: cob(I)yrinic acid a,c-diamide adenosyltransferase [Acidiferrobacterales bacterium]
MGNRLSKIYTRTGDKGTTGLGDGSRVDKDHPQVVAIGDTDELNCHLGVVVAELGTGEVAELIANIQHRLFDLGAELSLPPGNGRIRKEDVENLEQALDHYNEELPPLKEFILPGGSKAAAQCHLARAACRRTERSLVLLNHTHPVSEYSLSFLNRLSDLLFVLARYINRESSHPDILWKPLEKPGSN